MRLQPLRTTSRVEKSSCAYEESQYGKESQPGTHQAASLALADQSRRTLNVPCKAKSIAKESTKMIQPEKVWKKPSPFCGSQYCTTSPVPMIRKPLATTAMGIAAITRASLQRVRASTK